MPAIKKTFAELQDETEASRYNSNLQNLASAYVAITEDLERIDTLRAGLVKIQADITAAGESPSLALAHDLFEAGRKLISASRY